LATRVAADLVELAHCHIEAEDMAASFRQLRGAITDAEAVATHFDCHDRVAEEALKRLEAGD
jgi:hypothetical protein